MLRYKDIDMENREIGFQRGLLHAINYMNNILEIPFSKRKEIWDMQKILRQRALTIEENRKAMNWLVNIGSQVNDMTGNIEKLVNKEIAKRIRSYEE